MAIKKEPSFKVGEPLFTYDGLQVVRMRKRYQNINAGEHAAFSPEEVKDLLDGDKLGPFAEHPTDRAVFAKARRQWRDRAGREAIAELKEREAKGQRSAAHEAAMKQLEALEASESGKTDAGKTDKGGPPEK